VPFCAARENTFYSKRTHSIVREHVLYIECLSVPFSAIYIGACREERREGRRHARRERGCREEGREGEGGREGGRKGGKEGGTEGGREGRREEGDPSKIPNNLPRSPTFSGPIHRSSWV